VIDEILHLIGRYRIEALYFAEDMFLSDRNRAENILGLFLTYRIHKKIKWFAQAKVTAVNKDLLKLMKEAGCVGVEYGFESGSQRILDAMNKKVKVEDNLRVARLTNEVGLRYQANIITGYPGETREDFQDTVKFLKKIKPSNIGFNFFMALPGTPEYRRLKESGRLSYDWDNVGNPEISGLNYTTMPLQELRRLYSRTRLNIILPLNLYNFIADNIANPLRFLYLIVTQFRGILIKTIRSELKTAFNIKSLR